MRPRRTLFHSQCLFQDDTRLQSPSDKISWHDAAGSESGYSRMADRRRATLDGQEPGSLERGAGGGRVVEASWAPVPQTFRAADGSLAAPWADIFGPLRQGKIDD